MNCGTLSLLSSFHAYVLRGNGHLGLSIFEQSPIAGEVIGILEVNDGGMHVLGLRTGQISRPHEIMAKVIEFYIRAPVPKKVKSVPIDQRGKLVEFPKEKFAVQSKTDDITETW